MSTCEAGQAVALGVRRVFPDATVTVCPMADGGEGSADVILQANQGIYQDVQVQDPLGRPITAQYGQIPKTRTAVLEVASAAGITLITAEERNPMYTTTYGVGELIRDAIEAGYRQFVVGLGGSATNDGGIGMLSALGFAFLDADGKPVSAGAQGLSQIASIHTKNILPALSECHFLVACDVQNPLCGPTGCSAVFGPQKGADAAMVSVMDAAMAHFAELTKAVIPDSDANAPGCGAAGGLGFAFLSYLNSSLQPGIQLMIAQTGLEAVIREADVVVTGEGRLDGQSPMGKTPVGVAAVGKKYGKPVIAFSGCVTEDAGVCNRCGIDAFFPIIKAPCSLEDAMNSDNAKRNLADTVEQAFRLIHQFGGTRDV